MKIYFCSTLILISLAVQEVAAQRNWNQQTAIITPWEIGFLGGISTFITSVNPESETTGKKVNYWNRDLNPGFGLSVVRNISPVFGVEMSWLNTRLSGTWNDKYPLLPISAGHDLPLTFNSQINQLDLLLVFNVNQMVLPGDDEDLWHLFFKTGIGATQIKDKMEFYPGVNYMRMSLSFDVGASVSVNQNIKIMAGSTLRIVNTDNLDGVHVESDSNDGQWISYMKVFEIYNYTYLKVSFCLGESGSNKSSSFRQRRW